jgi:hypothetical protein
MEIMFSWILPAADPFLMTSPYVGSLASAINNLQKPLETNTFTIEDFIWKIKNQQVNVVVKLKAHIVVGKVT